MRVTFPNVEDARAALIRAGFIRHKRTPVREVWHAPDGDRAFVAINARIREVRIIILQGKPAHV